MKMHVRVDGMGYDVDLFQTVTRPIDAPRLVIVSYLPNKTAVNILCASIAAIQKYTDIPYELWVIDNNSPAAYTAVLSTLTDVNVIYNRRTPTPLHKYTWYRRLYERIKQKNRSTHWGSYANGIALEIASRLIDPESQYLMTLHMDVMPCAYHWLSFLKEKMNSGMAAAGVRMDTKRTSAGVLHVLGYMVDFQLFKKLELTFMPALPQYDVGDVVTVKLREHQHSVYACRNTIWDKTLIERIPATSPLRHFNVDRALDDADNVIFLHLGRGIRKAHNAHSSGVSVQEWINFSTKTLGLTLNTEGTAA